MDTSERQRYLHNGIEIKHYDYLNNKERLNFLLFYDIKYSNTNWINIEIKITAYTAVPLSHLVAKILT